MSKARQARRSLVQLRAIRCAEASLRWATIPLCRKVQKWDSFLVRVDPFSGDRSCHGVPLGVAKQN